MVVVVAVVVMVRRPTGAEGAPCRGAEHPGAEGAPCRRAEHPPCRRTWAPCWSMDRSMVVDLCIFADEANVPRHEVEAEEALMSVLMRHLLNEIPGRADRCTDCRREGRPRTTERDVAAIGIMTVAAIGAMLLLRCS